MENKTNTMKEKFIEICKNKIKREGIDNVLKYLEEKTDFFTAPASSKFHGSYPGGLVEHSLNVYNMLSSDKSFVHDSLKYSPETIAIVSLFHDVCKANLYKETTRNVKKNGVWVQEPYYTTEEEYPAGHGEKSVIILLREGLRLSEEEALAILWHMGGFDMRVKGGSYSIGEAYNKSTLALELHLADMRATYITENIYL